MRRALLALVALVPAQCDDPAPAPPSDRPAQHIIIPEGYAYRFNAEGGDRLDLIMDPSGDWVDRCNRSGGEPIWNPYSEIATWEDVDF